MVSDFKFSSYKLINGKTVFINDELMMNCVLKAMALIRSVNFVFYDIINHMNYC
jgi:hypothetical protein